MNAEDTFLKSSKFAVVGASENRSKYGNKCVRVYQQNNMDVVPVNPTSSTIEGLPVVASVQSLPADVDAVSIVTPPKITAAVVDAALEKGIKQLWMQPGAENADAIAKAKSAGANVIAGGPCVLVALGYQE